MKPKDYRTTIGSYFDKALTELSEVYDPKTALEASQFAVILMGLDTANLPKKPDKKKPEPQGALCYVALVEDELEDADKYWELYQQTGEPLFHRLAKEEVAHANALLDKGISTAQTQEARQALTEQKTRWAMMEKVIR